MASYLAGNQVRVSAEFTDIVTGAEIDPPIVKLSVCAPSGSPTVYIYGVDANVIRDAIGMYHADLDIDSAGTWLYKWWSVGTGKAAGENSFYASEARC